MCWPSRDAAQLERGPRSPNHSRIICTVLRKRKKSRPEPRTASLSHRYLPSAASLLAERRRSSAASSLACSKQMSVSNSLQSLSSITATPEQKRRTLSLVALRLAIVRVRLWRRRRALYLGRRAPFCAHSLPTCPCTVARRRAVIVTVTMRMRVRMRPRARLTVPAVVRAA